MCRQTEIVDRNSRRIPLSEPRLTEKLCRVFVLDGYLEDTPLPTWIVARACSFRRAQQDDGLPPVAGDAAVLQVEVERLRRRLEGLRISGRANDQGPCSIVRRRVDD